MRRKSHVCLGKRLLREYLPDLPRPYAWAFLLGCTEPDTNPATYLKGSIRSQFLRGHNYGNASRFMSRLYRRLSRKEMLHLWDYYSLGKLIHYTADSFTYVHNSQAPEDLQYHREYEHALQEYFLSLLEKYPLPRREACIPGMDYLRTEHQRYLLRPARIPRDASFAFRNSCLMMENLVVKN